MCFAVGRNFQRVSGYDKVCRLSQHPILKSITNKTCDIANIELLHDVRAMSINRSVTYVKLIGNFLIGVSRGNKF